MNTWISKGAAIGELTTLSDDAVTTAQLKNEQLEEMKARIDGGESPLNVLEKEAKQIPYFKIKSVRFDEHDEDFSITYQAEKESKSETLTFANETDRNDAFQQLQSHLGDKFTVLTEHYSKLRAVYMPLLTLTIMGFLTWAAHGAAAEIAAGREAEIHGGHKGLKVLFYWLLDLIGPIGVLIVGGLLMALVVLVLVQRFKEPPIITTLKEGVQKPSRGIGTAIKYAILAGLWYLFVPALFSSIFS